MHLDQTLIGPPKMLISGRLSTQASSPLKHRSQEVGRSLRSSYNVPMEGAVIQAKADRAWFAGRALVVALAGIVLTVWLLNTPAGLLGKADAIGYAVCHQIDLRSFHLGVRSLPLCARCSGMYLGAMLTFIFYLSRGRGRAGLMPGRPILAVMAVFFLAWAVDGVNSYLHFLPGVRGLYEPTNTLRLITGSLVGVVMATVVYTGFNQTVWHDWRREPALRSVWDLGLVVILTAGLVAVVLSDNPLILYPLALLSALAVVLLLSTIYTMIGLLVTGKENRIGSWQGLIFPGLAGLTLAFMQIGLADIVRFWITGTWGGLQL